MNPQPHEQRSVEEIRASLARLNDPTCWGAQRRATCYDLAFDVAPLLAALVDSRVREDQLRAKLARIERVRVKILGGGGAWDCPVCLFFGWSYRWDKALRDACRHAESEFHRRECSA